MKRGYDFLKKNGMRLTVSRILSKFERKQRHSYRSLRKNFPEKLASPDRSSLSGPAWKAVYDEAALASLELLLNRLDIRENPSTVLSTMKRALPGGGYCGVLDDIFSLEEIIGDIRGRRQYPLIQVSGLPKRDREIHRRKILFVTSQVPSPYHGGGNRILNFLKILAEDNDIYLATAYYPREDDDLLDHLGGYCHSLLKIPYWQFGHNQREIHKWLDGISMDVVHYEWPASLENYSAALGRLNIFTYMEAVSLRLRMDLDRFPPISSTWINTFCQLVHALRVEVAETSSLTARIAVTTNDGEFFRDFYPYQEYAVLNHGVNLKEFVLDDIEPEPQSIVFIGNFGHYPNVDAMVFFMEEVWASLRSEVPQVRLYIVGPNPPAEITKYADNHNVMVTGGVPDVRSFIQKATICIAPLVSGAGLRGKVIEYAALRRTFVATSLATADLAYEHGREYLKADSAADFALNITRLLKDGTLRRKMAKSAFETTLANYDTRLLVDFLYRFYDHLELESQLK